MKDSIKTYKYIIPFANTKMQGWYKQNKKNDEHVA